MLPRVLTVIENKWSAFAERHFLQRFVLFVVYLFTFAGWLAGPLM